MANSSLRARLDSHAASFDYEYFRFHDDESFELDGSDAEKLQARVNFSKARAISAAFAAAHKRLSNIALHRRDTDPGWNLQQTTAVGISAGST